MNAVWVKEKNDKVSKGADVVQQRLEVMSRVGHFHSFPSKTITPDPCDVTQPAVPPKTSELACK